MPSAASTNSHRRCPRCVPRACNAHRRPLMQIRAGFEMIYDCPQPTPMILDAATCTSRASSDLVGRDDLVCDPPVPMAAYRDSFGNWCTRIVAPDGPHAASRPTRWSATAACPIRSCPTRGRCPSQRPARGNAAVPARQPLLRDRPAVRDRVEPVRQRADGMGPRAGDLRLRPPPHHVRLRACAR